MLGVLAIVVTMASCPDLCTDEAFHHYRLLLVAANWGWDEREQAAFLVRTADGRLTAKSWHAGDHYRASYRGTIPEQSVAIVHTHPGRDIFPSDRDRALARRIRMPVIVVTASAVTAAYPDGAMAYLAEGVWFKRSTR